ncbi:MAG: tyrosine-type recombinase/integrase [Pseudonocardiaceae bacterium]
MTGRVSALVEDYVTLRRSLGYRSPSQERSLRAFAHYLNQDGHDGPIPLESSLDWATSTASTDPCNPARRLTAVRGFLRHLSAADGATEVPPPGLLGPTGHRRPPHVYSDREIGELLRAAAGLSPADGLRPRCYATLFGLVACTGLRISEALALSCADVDLAGGMLTVRAGKRGRSRLVPLHPSALPPLPDYAAGRARRYGPPGEGEAFFSAPTAATGSATTLPITPSSCCAGSWAGPRLGAPGRHACTTCATGWWCGGSRPGTPTTWTSTPRSRCWRPTSATWRCVRSTGTCRLSRS